MRKIVLLFLAVLFMAVPAMATSTVTITCTPSKVGDVNWVTVHYASDPCRIRAFGLDITLGAVDGNITQVVPLDPCGTKYRIYPGQISIINGDVNGYGTCYDPCDLGDANLAIEMGSLYTTDPCYASDANAGYNKIPGLSGDLLKFTVDGNTCSYTVDVNVRRGGIVMENPDDQPSFGTHLCSGDVLGCVSLCTVPLVVGKSSNDANTAILGATLTVGSRNGKLSCQPLNQVLEQRPANGTQVTCQSAVDYNYSLYQTTVPPVVGKTRADANTDILAANLVPVGTGVLSCLPLNQVLAQNPVGSTVVTCNSNVNYDYSLYQKNVPNVAGMKQADANAALIADGFSVGTITVSATCGTAGDFNVVSTTPAGGSPAGCGSAVAMVRCECYAGQADYAQWSDANKPVCWCYTRQCHGDADGIRHGTGGITGYWYVGQPDLDIMSVGWLVKDPTKGPGILNLKVNGVPVTCADFGHDRHGTGGVTGYWRIGQPDLDKMSLYWLVKEPTKGTGTPPNCLPGNRP